MLNISLNNFVDGAKKGCSAFLCAGVLFSGTPVKGASFSSAAKTGARIVGGALVLGGTYTGGRIVANRVIFPGAFSGKASNWFDSTDKKFTFSLDGKEKTLERKKVEFSTGRNSTYKGFTFACDNPSSDELKGKCVILYGGNGESVAYGASKDLLMKFADKGAKIVAVDYRGFGESVLPWPESLRISQKTVYEDGEKVYDYARNTLKYSPENIVVFGYSLGGAVASHVLEYASGKKEKVAGGVFASPIDGLKERATIAINKPCAWVAKFVTGADLNTAKNLEGVKDKDIPLLFVSGDSNDWISLNSTHLDKKAKEDLKFKNVFTEVAEDCGHNEVAKMFANEKTLQTFLGAAGSKTAK